MGSTASTFNICPQCGKIIFEEFYGGTVSPDLCACEPDRVLVLNGIERHHLRGLTPASYARVMESAGKVGTELTVKMIRNVFRRREE